MKISVRKQTKKPRPIKKPLPAPPVDVWGQGEEALTQCGYEWGQLLREFRSVLDDF